MKSRPGRYSALLLGLAMEDYYIHAVGGEELGVMVSALYMEYKMAARWGVWVWGVEQKIL
jgi:hypothetical protein